MSKKAVLTGKIIRVAKADNSYRTEVTIDVRETTIEGKTFTIGTQVKFSVSNSVARDMKTKTASPLATGDEVVVEAEKNGSYGWTNGWVVTALSHHQPDSRPISEFLDDLEKELGENK